MACRSTTLKGEVCRNRHAPFSLYCWRHQDPTLILSTLVSLLITVLVVIYQERSPSLEASFNLVDGGDPSALICIITNHGRAEAKDVFLSFNNMLPLETKVLGSPELGLSVLESDAPPDPQQNPVQSKLQKAFAVRIPRIASKDTITFQVVTLNEDNKRAGKQMVRIRQEGDRALISFIDQLSQKHPSETKEWRKELVMNAQVKNDGFFTPAVLSYENGRQDVSLLTEAEQLANALNQDLYAKYKKEFIDAFQGRPEFKAPVVRIKTSQGHSTYALFPPYVRTFVEMVVPVKQLGKDTPLNIPIPVPSSY